MLTDNKFLIHHKKIAAIIIIFSIILSFFSPIGKTIDKIAEVSPQILIGVGITEGLFVIGLLIMAGVVGFELGPNPLKWKRQFKKVAHHLPEDNWFWVGFWINATGALGSGVVVAWGVIKALPPQSWGLIWIPFLDLGLTIVIRASILELKREYQQIKH